MTPETVVALIVGFAIGGLLTFMLCDAYMGKHTPEEKLIIVLLAAANALLTVNVAIADSEGNKIEDVPGEHVGLEVRGFTGDFGSIVEGTNQINPGAAGAVGTVRISDKRYPELGWVDAEITLEAGAPASLNADFYQNGVQLEEGEKEETPPEEPAGE